LNPTVKDQRPKANSLYSLSHHQIITLSN